MYTYIINPGLISTLNYTSSPTDTHQQTITWNSLVVMANVPGHCPVTSSLALLVVTILNLTDTFISAQMIKVTDAYITLIYYHGDTIQAPMLLSMQAVRVTA